MITSIDSFGELVIAFSDGTLSSTTKQQLNSYISQVLCVNKFALVFLNNAKRARTYILPQLEPIPKLSLNDCLGGCVLSSNMLAVFTPATVRILQLTTTFKLHKTIDLKGVLSGCAHSKDDLLVATQEEYILLNLLKNRTLRLFPVLGLKPIMAPFNDGFLVVQGTALNEPAFCLFVNLEGEAAQRGLVLQFDKYPQSVCAYGMHVFAVVDSKLKVFKVEDGKSQNVDVDISGLEFAALLTTPCSIKCDAITKRLGANYKTDAYIALAYKSGHAEPFVIEKTLPILEAEKQIQNEMHYVPSNFNPNEKEYLDQLLVLNLLKAEEVSKALKLRDECQKLDYNVVLYIFHELNELPSTLMPGLLSLVKDLFKNYLKIMDFLVPFLKMKIKQLKRSPSTMYTSSPLLEIVYAKHLQNQSELVHFLLSKDVIYKNDIVKMLLKKNSYRPVIEYYKLSNNKQKLTDLYMKLIKEPNDLQNEALTSLITTLSSHCDLEQVVLVLLQLEKDDDVLKVVESEQFFKTHTPEQTLKLLKQHASSQSVWRRYLRHCSLTRNIFHSDLATLVVADLLEEYPQNINAINQSYKLFTKFKWPRPQFSKFLETIEYPQTLLKLQIEFWDTLLKLSENESWIIEELNNKMPLLQFERALVYKKFELHGQSMELFNQIGDFRSVVDYAVLNADCAFLALKLISRTNEHEVLQELLVLCAQFYSLVETMETLNDTPLYAVADFMKAKVLEMETNEFDALMRYSVARCASRSTK